MQELAMRAGSLDSWLGLAGFALGSGVVAHPLN